ncbi:hypothetical protein FDUTEX481_05594 [Tolypothrix sp. PCC 7601]|nr:hypothetical protein FDUTEX481_05594 [Tolypothrix sp. PCC 7601]
MDFRFKPNPKSQIQNPKLIFPMPNAPCPMPHAQIKQILPMIFALKIG